MYYQFLIRRFLSLISPIILFILFWFSFTKASWVWFGGIALAILILTFLSFWLIVGRRSGDVVAVGDHVAERSIVKFLPELVLLILFNQGALFFSIFLARFSSRLILAILTTLLYGLTLESLYRLLWRPRLYQIWSLKNLSLFLGLATLFWFTAGLYALNIFLGLGLTFLVLSLSLLTLFLTFHALYLKPSVREQVFWTRSIWYTLVITLITLELFVVLFQLPVIFHISGLVVAVFWYTAISLGRGWLQGSLMPGLVRFHLIAGGIILGVILALAQWR